MICPFFFFFNDTATTEIYTLSLHDALPIFGFYLHQIPVRTLEIPEHAMHSARKTRADRKSTRLNSSHLVISYAVFCLKKKKKKETQTLTEHRHCPTPPYTPHSYYIISTSIS